MNLIVCILLTLPVFGQTPPAGMTQEQVRYYLETDFTPKITPEDLKRQEEQQRQEKEREYEELSKAVNERDNPTRTPEEQLKHDQMNRAGNVMGKIILVAIIIGCFVFSRRPLWQIPLVAMGLVLFAVIACVVSGCYLTIIYGF